MKHASGLRGQHQSIAFMPFIGIIRGSSNLYIRLGQLNYEKDESNKDKWFPWFLRAAELGDPTSAFWIGTYSYYTE